MFQLTFRSLAIFAATAAWFCLGLIALAGDTPVIATQPGSLTAAPGTAVTFYVVAKGDARLAYQWSKDGVEIQGATADSLVLSEVGEADDGDYTVVVSGAVESVISAPAVLAVTDAGPEAPLIMAQPQSRTVASGAGVVFIVVAAGTQPLAYQWLKDGVEIVDATANVFVLTAVDRDDEGNYAVVVSNEVDSVGSESAALTITTSELEAPMILTQPESQTGTAGAALEFTVMATGSEPLSYQWFKEDVGIDGATTDSLAFSEVNETDVGSYTVVVSNEVDSVSSDIATLTIAGDDLEAPVITIQPESQAAVVGDEVIFTVLAAGTEPLDYQWFKDDIEIEGATNDSLVLSNAQEGDMGIYTVVVRNDADSVTSAPANLTITNGESEAPTITVQPESQTVATGADVFFIVVATGTEPLSYQWLKDGLEILGATAHMLGLSSVSAADEGSYAVLVSNEIDSITSDPAILGLTDAELEAPVIAAHPESQQAEVGADVIFTVVATGTEPMSYQWLKDGKELAGATSDFLVIHEISQADAGNYSVYVNNEVDSVISDPATLTVADPESEAPTITAQPRSQTVDSGAVVVFAVIATGAEPLSYHWFKDGDEIPGAAADMLVLHEVSDADEGNYTVVVSNDVDSVHSDPATLTVNDAESEAPVITVQPQSQTVASGAGVAFTVVATGSEPLGYHWFKDGLEMPGAGGNTLVFSEVSDADAGRYTVVVGNDIGSVSSEPATLRVNDAESEAPVIVMQPQSQAVAPGAGAMFAVAATGGGDPLHFQWFRNGVEILGAIADSLVLTAVSEADEGSYTVLVSNEVGSVMSEPAMLAFAPGDLSAPVITVQPGSQTVTRGTNVTLSVVAVGSESLGYQWFKDGVEIEGATADSLIVIEFGEANVGSYTVVVTDELHSVTSAAAELSLLRITTGLRIAWVSFHPDDESPTTNAVAAGFTQAPDFGYTQVLATNGHKITSIVSSKTPNIDLLNSFDLIIISRSVPSDDLQDPPDSLGWNSIAAPAIIMGAHVLRSNELGYATGPTIPDAVGAVNLTAIHPNHPIFAGIELNETNAMVNPFANLVTFNDTTQRGISVNTGPVAAEGKILATLATADDPAFGGVVIVEWLAGATMANATADTLAGHRLVFLSGSGDQAPDSQASGIFDLTEDGVRMFLNAVNYMAEPKARLDVPAIANGSITITWRNGGMLETATEFGGEWLSTGNNTGSHTEAIGTVNKFFRLQPE